MGGEQLRQRLMQFFGAMGSAVAPKYERIRGRLASMPRRRVIAAMLAIGLVGGAVLALFSGPSDRGSAGRTTAQLQIPAHVPRPDVVKRIPNGKSFPAFGPFSYEGIPVAPAGQPLGQEPAPELTEGKHGHPLPPDGTTEQHAWKVYGKPFDSSDIRPKIVIVITEFGLSSIASRAVIDSLPSSVTFVSSPYAEGLDYWIREAHADGHEVFVSLPVQAADPLVADAGPKAIPSLPDEETSARLEAVLAACTGCAGVMISESNPLLERAEAFSFVLNAIHDRGLMLFAATPREPEPVIPIADGIGLVRAWANMVLDEDITSGHMDEQLVELQELARRRGVAVGVARPLPATVRSLAAWWRTLESKGYVLAPLTAAANLQDAGM